MPFSSDHNFRMVRSIDLKFSGWDYESLFNSKMPLEFMWITEINNNKVRNKCPQNGIFSVLHLITEFAHILWFQNRMHRCEALVISNMPICFNVMWIWWASSYKHFSTYLSATPCNIKIKVFKIWTTEFVIIMPTWPLRVYQLRLLVVHLELQRQVTVGKLIVRQSPTMYSMMHQEENRLNRILLKYGAV